MDSFNSRLLSGRRVPNRHRARFIKRSALAIAIDALSSEVHRVPSRRYDRRPYRPGVSRQKPREKADSEHERNERRAPAVGRGPSSHTCRDQTETRSQTKISVSPGAITPAPAPRSPYARCAGMVS
ncbi:hypothetical protein GCM10018773_43720 [Streptomyces candidus]|nr:hypothetical protein GCM10018773_43720 [Streptomyces candidus]